MKAKPKDFVEIACFVVILITKLRYTHSILNNPFNINSGTKLLYCLILCIVWQSTYVYLAFPYNFEQVELYCFLVEI